MASTNAATFSEGHPASGAITPTEPTLNGDLPSAAVERLESPTGNIEIGTLRFYLVFASMMLATFLSAIDLTTVPTTLPTIIEHLHGEDFVWAGSAFTLGSTAILPLTGGFAQIFGRRPAVLASLAFFALGSGICGGAHNMNMLIAGRAIQGVGGGGILSLTEIVIADIVPLAQRGSYIGLIGA